MRTLKKTIVLVAIAATTVGGYQGYKAYNKPVESTLFMQNVEALTRIEDGEGDTSWYLHHFACSFTVATKAQATFLQAKVGATVDISYLTQFFNHELTNGEGPCEQGAQKTCYDVTMELINNLN